MKIVTYELNGLTKQIRKEIKFKMEACGLDDNYDCFQEIDEIVDQLWYGVNDLIEYEDRDYR